MNKVLPFQVKKAFISGVLALGLAMASPITGFSKQSLKSDLISTSNAITQTVPNQSTLAVADIDAVKQQISAAVGIAWRAETTENVKVVMPGHGAVNITFRRVFSKPGAPFVELVQATPAVGPWAADANHSSGYISYRVDDVKAAGKILKKAGFDLAAKAKGKFRVYEGPNGYRVEVSQANRSPSTGMSYQSQAPIDLGILNHLGWSIDVSNHALAKQVLSDGVGMNWLDDVTYPVPFYFDSASGVAVPGIYMSNLTISSSVETGPYVEFESGVFDLQPSDCSPSKTPCTLSPFDTSVDEAIFQFGVWGVEGSQIPAVLQQWQNAGLQRVMEYDPGTGTPLLGYYVGIGGILYEFNDASITR